MNVNTDGKLNAAVLPVLLMLFAFQCGFFNVTCVDAGYHIRTGELVLSGGRVPSANTFSFTQPDQPWLVHQWLSSVVYFVAYSCGGLTGLIAFKAVVGAAIFFVVWLSCRREAGEKSLWPFWAVTLGLMTARMRFFERPDMFSALFLALLFLLLRRSRRRAWLWGGVPALMAVWANMHAGVVYGFLLLLAFSAAEWVDWLWERARSDEPSRMRIRAEMFDLPAAAAISLAAVLVSVWLINPWGPQVLLAPFSYSFDPFWRNLIYELQPPLGLSRVLLFTYIVLLTALQLSSRRKPDMALALPTVLFAFFSFRSQRSLLLFAVVATPYLCGLLESVCAVWRPSWQRSQRWALPVLWIVLFAGVILPDRSFRYGVGLYPPYYPKGIYGFMKDNVPRQNQYNDMMYGGGILWFLYPDWRSFSDSRGEAYSAGFWRDVYVPVSSGKPLWRDVFRKYSIHCALVPVPRDASPENLAVQLRADPRWALVAFDDNALLFLERTEGNGQAIARYEYRLLWPGDTALSAVTAGSAKQALVEAARAVNFDPNGIFSRTALARSRMVCGDYAGAAEVYSGLIRKVRAGSRYWRDYGYCLYMAGRHSDAARVFSRMARRGIEPAFAFYMQHFYSLKRGNAEKALQLLERAVELDPKEEIYRTARDGLKRAMGAARGEKNR